LQNACTVQSYKAKFKHFAALIKQYRLLYKTLRSQVGICQSFEEFVGSIFRKETVRGGSTHQVILDFADDVELIDVHNETSQSLLQQSTKKLGGTYRLELPHSAGVLYRAFRFLPQCLAFSLRNFHHTVSGKTVKHSYHFVPSDIQLSNVFCNKI
jgi:hypothetical protein